MVSLSLRLKSAEVNWQQYGLIQLFRGVNESAWKVFRMGLSALSAGGS
jgi:hypothetical protein